MSHSISNARFYGVHADSKASAPISYALCLAIYLYKSSVLWCLTSFHTRRPKSLWGGQRKFCWPPASKPRSESVRANSSMLRSLDKAHVFTLVIYNHIRAFVSLIVLVRHPSHIARFVMSVVVDAVKSPAFRKVAHIGIKSGEVVPPLAHLDSPSTIVSVVRALAVAAAVDHGLPPMVDSGASHSVTSESLCCAFFSPASTAIAYAAHKLPRLHSRLHSAFAPAKPPGSPPFIVIDAL